MKWCQSVDLVALRNTKKMEGTTYQVRGCVWHKDKQHPVDDWDESAEDAQPEHVHGHAEHVHVQNAQINHLLKEGTHGAPDLGGRHFTEVYGNDHAERTGAKTGKQATHQQHWDA